MRRVAQIAETVERDERCAADIELEWDPAGGAFCVAFAALLIGTGGAFAAAAHRGGRLAVPGCLVFWYNS